MNFRPSHIPLNRFIEWVEAQLTAEEQQQLQAHIDGCARCRTEATEIRRLLTIMHSDRTPDPPAAVVARALRIFPPRPAPSTTSLLQRIVAALQFDSGQLTPALGLRSGAAAPRQLLFTAGDYDLDLRLTPAEQADGWILSGQVLGGDAPTGQVRLQGATTTAQVPLTAPGEFVLPPIVAGAYTLVVQLADTEIAVDLLQVGS